MKNYQTVCFIKSLVIGISGFCERKTLEMRKKLLHLKSREVKENKFQKDDII